MRALGIVLLLGTGGCAQLAVAPASGGGSAAAVGTVLDDWHDAAAEADEERYLGHFAPGAVFLGTDPDERWGVAEFEEYVRTYFPRGGWTYHPHDRFVTLAPDGRTAWFDEQLTHGSYGELRGTGVARWIDGGWRIAHYSLTFTIPNALARRVVEVVQEGE